MNNKGQSLILFVLLFPIIFLILVLVYDIGNMILLKLELDNINKLVMDYGITKIDKSEINIELEKMILKNKEDIDTFVVTLVDEKIYIVLKDSLDNNVSILKNMDLFEIKSSYVGYLLDDKKVIERNK